MCFPCRPASAAFMTAEEEEEEAVRRSSRQRRPPAHLSDDDHLASDTEHQSDDDKAPHMTGHFASRGLPQTFDEHLHGSDESDQSCYGAPLSHCPACLPGVLRLLHIDVTGHISSTCICCM